MTTRKPGRKWTEWRLIDRDGRAWGKAFKDRSTAEKFREYEMFVSHEWTVVSVTVSEMGRSKRG